MISTPNSNPSGRYPVMKKLQHTLQSFSPAHRQRPDTRIQPHYPARPLTSSPPLLVPSPHLSSPPLISPHLTYPRLTHILHLISPSSCLWLPPHLVSSHLPSPPQLVSYHVISPHLPIPPYNIVHTYSITTRIYSSTLHLSDLQFLLYCCNLAVDVLKLT